MSFQMKDAVGDGKPRFVYSPITIEHQGVNLSIGADGKVTLRGNVTPATDSPESEIEYDEVELPNYVIGRLNTLLKDTRSVDFSDSRPRYSHAAVTVEYPHGIIVDIKENGKVKIRCEASNGDFDEVEVSASLIFKAQRLLDATRKLAS